MTSPDPASFPGGDVHAAPKPPAPLRPHGRRDAEAGGESSAADPQSGRFGRAKAFRFPAHFLWGAATASHQVEGDNRWNDWWAFEQAGRLPHRSGEACRHYELFEADFDLARSWGHNAHRFSIEWSRIEPAEGEWNAGAVEHYRRVIAALRERGMEPIVTLHHFTNPQWFAVRGGWARRDSVERFRRYAEFTAARLSRHVRYWVTINEPTVYAKRGFVGGQWPPFRHGSWLTAAMVVRNMIRAHDSAYAALHERRPDAMVGIAHSAPFIAACDPRSAADRICTAIRDYIFNDSLFELFGAGRRLDFLGINYYARQVVRWRTRGASSILGAECREDHHDEPRRFNALGWEIYPAGLRSVLEKFSRFGVPLIVTENGIAADDDITRRDFLLEHLTVLSDCVDSGIDVRGYMHWSLMDNFEWAEGTTARFGLAAVDYATQARTPRAVALAYAAVCLSHALAMSRPGDSIAMSRDPRPPIESAGR